MGARSLLVGWPGPPGFPAGGRTTETEGTALDHLYPPSPASRWLAGPSSGWVLRLSVRSLARLRTPQGNDTVPGSHRRSLCHCGHRALFAENTGSTRFETLDVVGHASQYRTCSEHVLALRAHR